MSEKTTNNAQHNQNIKTNKEAWNNEEPWRLLPVKENKLGSETIFEPIATVRDQEKLTKWYEDNINNISEQEIRKRQDEFIRKYQNHAQKQEELAIKQIKDYYAKFLKYYYNKSESPTPDEFTLHFIFPPNSEFYNDPNTFKDYLNKLVDKTEIKKNEKFRAFIENNEILHDYATHPRSQGDIPQKTNFVTVKFLPSLNQEEIEHYNKPKTQPPTPEKIDELKKEYIILKLLDLKNLDIKQIYKRYKFKEINFKLNTKDIERKINFMLNNDVIEPIAQKWVLKEKIASLVRQLLEIKASDLTKTNRIQINEFVNWMTTGKEYQEIFGFKKYSSKQDISKILNFINKKIYQFGLMLAERYNDKNALDEGESSSVRIENNEAKKIPKLSWTSSQEEKLKIMRNKGIIINNLQKNIFLNIINLEKISKISIFYKKGMIEALQKIIKLINKEFSSKLRINQDKIKNKDNLKEALLFIQNKLNQLEQLNIKKIKEKERLRYKAYESENNRIIELSHANAKMITQLQDESKEKIAGIPQYAYIDAEGKGHEELIKGPTYSEHMLEEKYSWRDIFSEILPLLQTIGQINDLGYTHRDIKPENIIYDKETNKPKLIDFGICQKTGTAWRKDYVVGTYRYMSPNHYRSGEYKITDDIYSTGILIFKFLTGETPNQDFSQIDFKHLYEAYPNKDHPNLKKINPAVKDLFFQMKKDHPQLDDHIIYKKVIKLSKLKSISDTIFFKKNLKLFHSSEFKNNNLLKDLEKFFSKCFVQDPDTNQSYFKDTNQMQESLQKIMTKYSDILQNIRIDHYEKLIDQSLDILYNNHSKKYLHCLIENYIKKNYKNIADTNKFVSALVKKLKEKMITNNYSKKYLQISLKDHIISLKEELEKEELEKTS